MKKWAFACPPVAFLFIGLEIIFPGFLGRVLTIVVLFVLLFGSYLILKDKSLQTGMQKFYWVIGYFAFVMGSSALGGFIMGVIKGIRNHG